MTPIKDALGKARSGAVTAVKAPAKGASRAGGAVRDGFGWAAGGVRDGVGRATGRARAKVVVATRGPRERASDVVGRARQRPRFAVAVAAAILIGIAWIAWAIYVAANNGAAAGLGVVLTWPVLLGALALIAAPFVLTAMLVQRRRGSSPLMAGAPAVPDSPEQGAGAKTGPQKETKAEGKAEPEREPEPEQDPAAKSA